MIDHLDRLVLTTRHKEQSIEFYTSVLGMRLGA
jgi:catechol 2,3-dioxygenase-like lactoylglutathione lyase family enzyme